MRLQTQRGPAPLCTLRLDPACGLQIPESRSWPYSRRFSAGHSIYASPAGSLPVFASSLSSYMRLLLLGCCFRRPGTPPSKTMLWPLCGNPLRTTRVVAKPPPGGSAVPIPGHEGTHPESAGQGRSSPGLAWAGEGGWRAPLRERSSIRKTKSSHALWPMPSRTPACFLGRPGMQRNNATAGGSCGAARCVADDVLLGGRASQGRGRPSAPAPSAAYSCGVWLPAVRACLGLEPDSASERTSDGLASAPDPG